MSRRSEPRSAHAAGRRSRVGDTRAESWRGERGSASIWLVAAGVVVVLFGAGAAQAGAAMVARHQALAAADAGALAGARLAYAGPGVACDRAGELVGGNHARMTACEVDGLFVTVAAEVTVNAAITARATAKAGPVSG
ncbi:MAG TPA: Rv3654c family TadE-like protein [Rugosimonospora sp.]|nr:Rv3654c family TadE-like protein [Rugosimonospora sp.]